LVERVEEAAADPRYAQRKDMYTRHNRLEKVAKPPVCVHLHQHHHRIWQELIPADTLKSQDTLERDIEIQLRQKLYKHDHIPDDEVLLPTVWLAPVRLKEEDQGSQAQPSSSSALAVGVDAQSHGFGIVEGLRLWGLPFKVRRTVFPGGSYKVEPVVQAEADMALLKSPKHEVDVVATQALCDRATELVNGRLPVKLATDELGASPSEAMVSLMGMEAVLYGVIDRPDFIHQMMTFLTDGYISYHRAREAAGAVDAEESWGFRVHYEDLPSDADSSRLENSWWYVSAQSLAGISPAMFDEFLQPYHARLSEALSDSRRVYYHGCEDLTNKISIIRRLPHLRRFHVSPWTDLEESVKQLGREFVLETHVSYADTLYVHTPAEMRKEVERIMEIAGECVIDINLGDIETVDGRPSVLTDWARIAQEVTAQYM
jgi:hypothetical protein